MARTLLDAFRGIIELAQRVLEWITWLGLGLGLRLGLARGEQPWHAPVSSRAESNRSLYVLLAARRSILLYEILGT